MSQLCMPVLMVLKNELASQEEMSPSLIWETNKNDCNYYHGKQMGSAKGASSQGSGNHRYLTPTGLRNDCPGQQGFRDGSTPLAYQDTYCPSACSSLPEVDSASQCMASGVVKGRHWFMEDTEKGSNVNL